jgi:D-alanyl-D-alanine carboxypeptidase
MSTLLSAAESHMRALLTRGVKSVIARAEDRAGRVLFECAMGQARADDGSTIQPNSAFHVASVTKTLVATLLLQHFEEGLPVALEARIAELGIVPPEVIARLARRAGHSFCAEISLRHLLTHTSGMLDAFEDGEPTLPGIVALKDYLMRPDAVRAKRWRAWDESRPYDKDAGVLNYYLNSGQADAHWAAPGSVFRYSDTAYVIIALFLEHLTGRQLALLLEERIFTPLQMNGTYLAYDADPIGLGPARTPEADVWAGTLPMLSSGYSLSADWGGGGVVSTARDLSVFLRALLRGGFFRSAATLEAMTNWIAPEGLALPRLGMGLGIQRFAAGQCEVWGHTGSWGARMFYEPMSGIIFTGTINQAEGPWDWHEAFIALALHEVERQTEPNP